MSETRYRLGLDLGANSLGWTAISLDATGRPYGIVASGVRIFEAGVEGDITQGKDSSRAVKRREARQPRRQQWRRQFRKQKVFSLLQELGLLPGSDGNDPSQRTEVLGTLDTQLRAELDLTSLVSDGLSEQEIAQKLPYLLRSKAATEPVSALELGRAIYQLSQRRGYLSNRKGQRDDDDAGVVETDIGSLQAEMAGQTLGQHLAMHVNPAEDRIRRRYTSRRMYLDEFDQIRSIQSGHHSLADADWDRLRATIFFQRPLKSQKHLIGRCELEPPHSKQKHRRCDLCLPVAQEFRIRQTVNDLRVMTDDRFNEPLSEEERERLVTALNSEESLTWARVRRILQLPRTAKFSHQEVSGTLIGHRTNAKMITAFGDAWLSMSEEQRTAITREVLHYRKPDALKRRAMNEWGLDEEEAECLSRLRLEEDHASHSRQALERLLAGTAEVPGLRQGASYSTVRRALYPESFAATEPIDRLPPVNDWKPDIRNPAVIRAMTELRKVMNAIVERYGKPETIHIELARDLKNPRQRRKDIHKKNQENRKRREKAIQKILEEVKIDQPNRALVDKWLLAEECNHECPYCGKVISGTSLMGDEAEFNIEHIFPRRYLDNSYMNKTIACRKCNDQKGDRTPAQAFQGERYDQILQRVARFSGPARDIKLARFKTEVPEEDFVTRQLNDTRYNSRLAADYVGLLFGGRTDAEGNQRIILPTGAMTSQLRAMWQLNTILGHSDQKERDDHRHHAIDAAVVGLIDQGIIQQLSQAASSAGRMRSRHFTERLEAPWNGFLNDVSRSIDAIHVSHRPTRTIAGPLHAESIYSKNHGTDRAPDYRIRKELSKLTATEISGEKIVDPNVREAVQAKWIEHNQIPPAKLWGDRTNESVFPRLAPRSGTGPGTIIRKVRLKASVKARRVGSNARIRNIASGKDANFASMIYAIIDSDGNEIRWVHEIINRLEAHERKSRNVSSDGEKVLLPDDTPGRRFKFALRKNDMVLVDGPDGQPVLYRIQSLSQTEIQLCEDMIPVITNPKRTPWNRIRGVDSLRQRNCHVVSVLPLGELVMPGGLNEN